MFNRKASLEQIHQYLERVDFKTTIYPIDKYYYEVHAKYMHQLGKLSITEA